MSGEQEKAWQISFSIESIDELHFLVHTYRSAILTQSSLPCQPRSTPCSSFIHRFHSMNQRVGGRTGTWKKFLRPGRGARCDVMWCKTARREGGKLIKYLWFIKRDANKIENASMFAHNENNRRRRRSFIISYTQWATSLFLLRSLSILIHNDKQMNYAMCPISHEPHNEMHFIE